MACAAADAAMGAVWEAVGAEPEIEAGVETAWEEGGGADEVIEVEVVFATASAWEEGGGADEVTEGAASACAARAVEARSREVRSRWVMDNYNS